MKKSYIIWIVVILVVIAGGGYWWWYMQNASEYAVQPSAYQAQPTAPAQPAARSTAVTVAYDAALGNYLVANGMTLYRFTKDSAGVSNCTGQCATIWPPFVAPSTAPVAPGSGVTGAFGSLTRADGTQQVTYNGTPLYFYSKDMKAGDTTGQNFNGLWFVVSP